MRFLLFLFFLLNVLLCCCQQLVADPGLEDTLKCPYTLGRFYHATNTNERYIAHWRSSTRASCDLHNTCGYNWYQPRTGDGYAGIILYDPAGTREYITALFSQPMEAGECYFVEFYVALRENCTVGVLEVQAHISDDNVVDPTWPPPAPMVLTPHIQATAPMTSTTYSKVSGLYTAQGGETTITIGNFLDNNNTTLGNASQFGSVSAYYFVDDVTVTKLDIGDDVSLCSIDSVLFASNIICPSLNYNWNNGDAGTSSYVTTYGEVSLAITDGNNTCTMTDEAEVVELSMGAEAGSDGNINIGESVVLYGSGGGVYGWTPPSTLSCDDCPEPTASPSTTTTYYLTVSDSSGCSDLDSVTVFVTDTTSVIVDPVDTIVPTPSIEEAVLFVPNAFSPNGDGINDVFKAEGGPFTEFDFLIFDRWGHQVFYSSEKEIGWDGNMDEKQMPVGVYIYQVYTKDEAGNRLEANGTCVLIR